MTAARREPPRCGSASAGLVLRQPPAGGIAGRLADRLFDLADAVRWLPPPDRRDPEPTTPSASNIQSEIAMKAARRVVASYSSLTSSTPKP
jgi:hypothetical protein